MSQHHLRREKVCLNCGSPVHDKYCSHCGQLNSEPGQSFGHLMGHFLADITHYDSQFLTTIKDLVFRPGFLTKEYISGKRASYLDPIRMYIFISAVFFLVMFSQHSEETVQPQIAPARIINPYRQHIADSLRGVTKITKDSVKDKVYGSVASSLDTIKTSKDTSQSIEAYFSSNGGILTFKFGEHKYTSVRQYDSIQAALAVKDRDSWMDRYVLHKIIPLTHQKGASGEFVLKQSIEHDIPKIMFILLPLFAFFVGFFYSRKKYFYSQHFIFSLHFHSFVFIAFLVDALVVLVADDKTALFITVGVTVLVLFVYLVAALYRAYGQSLAWSLLKGVAISVLYFAATLVGICVALIGAFVFM